MSDGNSIPKDTSRGTELSTLEQRLSYNPGHEQGRDGSIEPARRRRAASEVAPAPPISESPAPDSPPAPAAKSGPPGEKVKMNAWKLLRFHSDWDKFLCISGVLLACTQGAVMPLFGLLTGNAVDAISPTSSADDTYEALLKVSWEFGCIVGAIFVAACSMTYLAKSSSNRAMRNARFAYLEAILRQDIEWFDLGDPAALPAKMETDLVQYQAAVSDKSIRMFACFGQAISGIILGFTQGWIISLLFLSVAPIMIGGTLGLVYFIKKGSEKNVLWYSRASAVVEEVLNNMRTVVAFGGEAGEVKRYETRLDVARVGGWRNTTMTQLLLGIMISSFSFAYALCIWYGGTQLIVKNTINSKTGLPFTSGEVVGAFFSIMVGISALKDIVQPLQSYAEGCTAAAAIQQIVFSTPIIEPKNEDEEQALPEDLKKLRQIEFRNVHFQYPSRQDVTIFSGINLTITAGQKVAFVGESGGGKSTLIQLLERFYDPVRPASEKDDAKNGQEDPGQVLVNGMDLKDLPVLAWRREIGYVGQEPFVSATSILENIRSGCPTATDEDCVEAAKMARADEFVQTFPDKYNTHVGNGGSALSGGQKQRIAIARALIKRPNILLLDEATSALDNESEKMVQATIDSLQSTGTLTTIIVAHRLSTIRASDRIFFLASGQVAEQGTHQELMALQGGYWKLVQTQEGAARKELADAEASLLAKSSANASQPAASVDDVPADEKSNPMVGEYIPADSAAGSDLELAALSDANAKAKASKKNAAKCDEKYKKMKGSGWGEDGVFRPDEVTTAYIEERIKSRGEKVNDKTREKERTTVILKEGKYKVNMKRLWSYTKKENVWIPFGILFAAAAGANMPTSAYILANSIGHMDLCDLDRNASTGYIDPNDPCIPILEDKISTDAIAWTCTGVAVVVCYFFVGFITGYIAEWSVLRIRAATFAALMRQEIAYHDHPDHAPGIMSSWMATSALAVAELVGPILCLMLTAFSSMCVGVVYGYIGSWQIALVLSAMTPAILAGAIYMMGRMFGKGQSASIYSQGGQVASEAILNIRTVRALNGEKPLLDLYRKTIDPPYNQTMSEVKKEALAFGASSSMFFLTNIVAYAYGAYLLKVGAITGSDLFQALMCIMFGVMGAGFAAGRMGDAMKAKVAAFDLFAVIDRKSKINAMVVPGTESTGAEQTIGDGTICLQNVDFRFPHRPDTQVLKDVSITVQLGQTVAFVGPSGSGKSTMIQLLMRFYDPESGKVTVGGKDVRQLDLFWWRQQLGLVGQEPVLFDMSVEDNIKYGKPDATREEVEAAARKANMDFVLSGDRMTFEDSVGPRGGKLSGGQKQRVAIARALIRDPTYLLLDEATSALDSQSEKVVQDALDAAAVGRTTFIVAHRLSTVRNADKIFVVAMGSLVEQGNHEELLAIENGVYKKLVQKGMQ